MTFLLLILSALISGSEVAFFSLNPKNKAFLEDLNTLKSKTILILLQKPEKLLATILIANNFVNVGIVILSTYITTGIFNFSEEPILGFVIQVIIVTFLLLLFGEILPKVYAARYAIRFSIFMALPIKYMQQIFSPLSYILVSSTSFIHKRVAVKNQLSVDELSQALDITSESRELKEDEKILKGIVKFGQIEVREIMKPRIDVVSIETSAGFKKLISLIVESGFSRIPAYEDSFDNIKGVIYIKDLIPYLDKSDDFNWGKLIRPPYFVPENKKIDDLLKEFQTKKIHLAIVIDEYGGTSGIITMEDILEEIVGEINDEFDDINQNYSKLKENEYLFEGKTSLNDFCKILEIDDDIFDNVKGESDTIAGFILELTGEIPSKNQIVKFKKFEFQIKAVDNRRIKQIFVKFTPQKK
ncbi:MAG: gliding motility-associated protein GldE [Bacteroidales bacterium]|nr:gliding motility-associated protein GldE [Bacteroidales bacterium]